MSDTSTVDYDAQAAARTKRADCSHQFEAETCCVPAFLNYYECKCGSAWNDTWSCMCNDRCPACNVEIEPHVSEPIAPCACEYLRA